MFPVCHSCRVPRSMAQTGPLPPVMPKMNAARGRDGSAHARVGSLMLAYQVLRQRA
jgi:hypothetical protein